MTTELARFLDAIPVVSTTGDRDTLLSAPTRNQRVHNLATKTIQRFTGAGWVDDFVEAAASGPGPVFNVLSYGDPHDGVADSGIAWNLARAAVPASGGTVFVPPGSYNLVTPFSWGAQTKVQLYIAAGVTLTGAAIPAPTAGNSLINLSGAQLVGGSTALTLADNYLAQIIGINFGGQPRFQIGSNFNATPGQDERLEYLAEFGLGSDAADKGPALVLTRVRGTLPAAGLHVLNNDILGSLWFAGRDGDQPAGGIAVGAKIEITAFGDWSATGHGARFIFRVTADGSVVITNAWEMRGDTHFWPSTTDVTDIGNITTPRRVRTLCVRQVVWGRTVPAYGANVVINAGLGMQHEIVPTDGAAFTVNAPSGTMPLGGSQTQRLCIRIKNTFGVLGAATFAGGAGGYRLGAAWTQPANGFSRSIVFDFDGTNWIETSRSAADVAN